MPAARNRNAPFEPKVVAITGASAGVGRAVALRFARAGARVGLIARDESALEEVRREVEEQGGKAVAAPADVADAEAVFRAAATIEAQLGPIDLWINDAMETVFSRVVDMSPEEFRRVTEVTYLGFVHGSMAALRVMRPRGRGRILQMGSALAYRGIPLQSAYCGAKHAIRGFSDSLRTELMHDGLDIGVTIVDLPAMNTPQFEWARAHIAHTPRPMGQPIQPEAVAEHVYRAALGGRREYWIGGATLATIVGNIVAPAFLDRYLARKAVAGQQTPRRISPHRRDNLDRPITELHATRGPFSSEASDSVRMVAGDVARLGIVAAGAALFFAFGALVAGTRRA